MFRPTVVVPSSQTSTCREERFPCSSQMLHKSSPPLISVGHEWPSELSSDPEEMFLAVLCVWNFHVCPLHWCENRRNGKRVNRSNCNNVKTCTFITVSPAWSRFTKLTQFLQTMSRLVCDTQYGSGKDTVFYSTRSIAFGFSQRDAVTCCDNRWRHCFVTSLHRWWTELVGLLISSKW